MTAIRTQYAYQESRSGILFGLAGEVAGLLLIAIVIHALVLRFVFPGFYAPTLFEHSDFYIPVSFRYSDHNLLSMLEAPRPIGMAYLYLSGWLGTDGAILATLGIIFINMVIMAMAIRRALQMDMTLGFIASFSIFCLCIFDFPSFSAMATHDALAQLSFLFLVMGFSVFFLAPFPRPVRLAVLFTAMVFGFLSKETYVLSALWLLVIIGLKNRRSGIFFALSPLIAGLIAFLIAVLYSIHVKSGFILGSADPEGSYAQSHDPLVILFQFLKYIEVGFPYSVLIFLALFFAIIIILLPRSHRIFICCLIVGGLVAIIPNSTLPHHFFSGYSWNMGYLLFTPFLALPLSVGRLGRGFGGLACLLAAVFSAVALPYYWTEAYSTNDWVMHEANIQRNIRQSLAVLTTAASFGADHRHVLVTGIRNFSPFDEGAAIREWVGSANVEFDIVAYVPREPGTAFVHFMAPNDVVLDRYTDIWTFDAEGNGQDVLSYMQFPDMGFLGKREMILYPSLLATLGVAHFAAPKVPINSNQYVSCGVSLEAYNAFDLAVLAFDRAIVLMPKNASAFYFEANAYESLGRREEALKAAQSAVATDDPLAPNMAFKRLADRLANSN